MRNILTSKGQSIIVDDEDFEYLNQFTWFVDSKGYARTTTNIRKGLVGCKKMHRLIMSVTDPKTQIDHINRNKLDNRKSNLRLCTNYENSLNRGLNKNSEVEFKGVRIHKYMPNKKYQARIKLSGKSKSLGYYVCPKIAARVYDIVALINYKNNIYINNVNLRHE